MGIIGGPTTTSCSIVSGGAGVLERVPAPGSVILLLYPLCGPIADN